MPQVEVDISQLFLLLQDMTEFPCRRPDAPHQTDCMENYILNSVTTADSGPESVLPLLRPVLCYHDVFALLP